MPTHRILLTLTVFVTLLTRTAFGVELPPEVRAALEQNARELGPIDVAWTYSGHSSFSAEQFAEKAKIDLPMAAYFLSSSNWRTAWQGGRYFCQIQEKQNGQTRFNEGSFDGQLIYMGNRDDDGATLSKIHPTVLQQEHGQEAAFANARYFEMIGLPLPTKLRELAGRAAPCSEVLTLLADPKAQLISVEPGKVDGEAVIRLTLRVPDPERVLAEKTDLDAVKKELEQTIDSPEFKQRKLDAFEEKRRLPEFREYIFDLDPALNYAMRQCAERYPEGGLLRIRRCADFQRVEGRSLWLPSRCEDQHYTFWSIPGVMLESPIICWVYEVSQIKGDAMPQEVFKLHYDHPDAVIYDRTQPVGKH